MHFEACESYSAAKAMVTSTADLAAGQGQSDRNDIEHISVYQTRLLRSVALRWLCTFP